MDGFTIATIVLTVLLIASGGYIKLLAKEINELISAITIAIEDGRVNRGELKAIVKEATDVRDLISRIHQLATRKNYQIGA